MSDQILTILKYGFLALLYLFLFYVVMVVTRELRAPQGPPAKRDTSGSGARGFRVRFLEPPARAGDTVTITKDTTLGRGGGCGIVLSNDNFVSQVHARLYSEGKAMFVEDLNSTNGTYVNGGQLKGSTRLRKGDQVRIGETVLEVMR